MAQSNSKHGLENILYKSVRLENNVPSFFGHHEQIGPHKFLKYWGEDYPYLKGSTIDQTRWLPVPERYVVRRGTDASKRLG